MLLFTSGACRADCLALLTVEAGSTVCRCYKVRPIEAVLPSWALCTSSSPCGAVVAIRAHL